MGSLGSDPAQGPSHEPGRRPYLKTHSFRRREGPVCVSPLRTARSPGLQQSLLLETRTHSWLTSPGMRRGLHGAETEMSLGATGRSCPLHVLRQRAGHQRAEESVETSENVASGGMCLPALPSSFPGGFCPQKTSTSKRVWEQSRGVLCQALLALPLPAVSGMACNLCGSPMRHLKNGANSGPCPWGLGQ